MNRTLTVILFALSISCSGAQGTGADTAADEEQSDESEEYGDSVEALTLERVRISLQNQGCARLQILESAQLADPEGMVVVVTAEICEGYEELGPTALLVSAVGNEYLQSNTLHLLPGLHDHHAETVEVLELSAPRVAPSNESVVLLRYRTPPSSEADASEFIERTIVGTFSADALELSVVQPTSFDVRFGRGRLRGNGQLQLVDSDEDGDLDIQLDVTTTGERCPRGGACRNGELHCQQTSAWTGRRFSDTLNGDACLYIGQLEL